MMQRLVLSYKQSGVDIKAGDSLVDRIAPFAKQTRRKELISGVGGFAGLFKVDTKKYRHPVLVASTDGIGTKLKLAIEAGHISDLGQDLVAMCVNDLICCGAEPLFFLDYFATGKLSVKQGALVIQSIARSLKSINCTLLGGETAEMPGLYKKGDFDVAGFTVGVVDKKRIVDGRKVRPGDVLIGLVSSGIHSNGFSLVRRIVSSRHLNLKRTYPSFKKNLGQILLKPTTLYVNPILKLLKQFDIHAIAHITGGGIFENLPRVLPKGVHAVIDKGKINVPRIFRFLQEHGNVPENEMWRVFNMGIGFVLVVSKNDEKKILVALKKMRCPARIIGSIVRHS